MLENKTMIVHYYNNSISVKEKNKKYHFDVSCENFNELLSFYKQNFIDVCGVEHIQNPYNDGYSFNFRSSNRNNVSFTNFQMIMDRMISSIIIVKHRNLTKELNDEYIWLDLSQCSLDQFAVEYWEGVIILAYRQIFYEKELLEVRNRIDLAKVDLSITIEEYFNELNKSIDYYDYDIMIRLVNYKGKYQDIYGQIRNHKLPKKLFYSELKNYNKLDELIDKASLILEKRDNVMKKMINDYEKLSFDLIENYVKQDEAIPKYIYDYAKSLSYYDEEKFKLYNICIEKKYAKAFDDFYFNLLLSEFERLNVRSYLYRNMKSLELNRIENCFNKKFLFIYSLLELEFNKEIDYIRTFKNLEYVFDHNVQVLNDQYYKPKYNFLLSKEESAILTIFLYRLLELDCIKKLNWSFKDRHKQKYEKSLKQEIRNYPELEYLRIIDEYLPQSTPNQVHLNTEMSLKDVIKQILINYIDMSKDEELDQILIKCKMLGINIQEAEDFIKNNHC